jgi:hypothetical protein
MSLNAGFAELDITPTTFPVRTYFSSADSVLDPIYAHAAVFNVCETTLAFLSLDVVIVEAEYAERIRKAFAANHGISIANIMVCATHNHACPAVVERPGFEKEGVYIDFMVERGIETLDNAFAALEPVEFGVKSGFEERVSFNRRYIKKNGTVVSQPRIDLLKGDLLCHEGVVDPEIAVVAVKNKSGQNIRRLPGERLAGIHPAQGCVRPRRRSRKHVGFLEQNGTIRR